VDRRTFGGVLFKVPATDVVGSSVITSGEVTGLGPMTNDGSRAPLLSTPVLASNDELMLSAVMTEAAKERTETGAVGSDLEICKEPLNWSGVREGEPSAFGEAFWQRFEVVTTALLSAIDTVTDA